MRSSGDTTRRRPSRARPSGTGYMIAAVAAALALFFALWWMLVVGGDEAPWVPAGLAASVVLLVALSAREVVMRRAWTRYLLETSASEGGTRVSGDKPNASKKSYSSSLNSAALAAIQKQSAEAETAASPDSHLDVFHLCQNYLESTEESLRANNLHPEKRNALRATQERVRALEKHHLLTWARDSSRVFTHEAQKRVRVSDKIETANRAVECLDSALKVFPEEHELNESKLAIREFIASVKVAHWVELAERAAFKGHYRRAIDRYRDALFYLARESVNEEVRAAGEERIIREIELLRARLKSSNTQHE
jgi:tetratricopeptide (TPR) repeat protein